LQNRLLGLESHLKLHHPIPAILGNHIVLKNRVSTTIEEQPLLVLDDGVVDNLRLGTGSHPNPNARLLKAVAPHFGGSLSIQHQAHNPITAKLITLQHRSTVARHIHAAIAAADKLVLSHRRTTRFNHQAIASSTRVGHRYMAQSRSIGSHQGSVHHAPSGARKNTTAANHRLA
jgi:hypothetical protein